MDFSAFVFAVPRADAIVTAREENADATRTKFCEQVAYGRRILYREIVLVSSKRNADRLRDLLNILHVEQEGEPHEKTVAPDWLAGFERPDDITTNAVHHGCGRGRYGLCVLKVGGRLYTRRRRVEVAVVDLHDIELWVYRLGAIVFHE